MIPATAGPLQETVAGALARHLKQAGTEYAFGLPGGEIAPVIDALHRGGVPFVLTHHETTAACMAATYGDLTGRPGLCVATLGPGATNLATGLAHAYLDRSPVVAVVAQLPVGLRWAHTHQRIDLQAFFRPITKAFFQLHPETADRVIAQAIDTAVSERPGPVVLEVPRGLGSESLGPAGPASITPGGRTVAAEHFEITDLRPLIERVMNARRPIIVAGAGAVRGNAGDAVAAVAERLGCPVLVLPKAKGLLPEHHPYFGGVLEMTGTRYLFEWMEEADLIVAVGADGVEFDRPWNFSAAVLTIDRAAQDGFFPAAHRVVGSLTEALGALAAASRGRSPRWTPEEVAQRRLALLAYAAGDGPRRDGAAGGMAPSTLIHHLRAALPADAIVTVDTGFHKMAMGQLWRVELSGCYFLSNGLSTMGYALPAAMTAKLLYPHRHVMAAVGDGALLMTLGELETAARLCVGILVVVFVDGTLALIRRGQEARGDQPIGVDFGRPDYAAIAQAMGCRAFQVSAAEALVDVVPACLQACEDGQPALIAAAVEYDAYRQ